MNGNNKSVNKRFRGSCSLVWVLMLPAMCYGVQAGTVAYVYTSHTMCSIYITELIFTCLPTCAAITIQNTALATQLYF
jgi:hypothetical protein